MDRDAYFQKIRIEFDLSLSEFFDLTMEYAKNETYNRYESFYSFVKAKRG